MSKYVMRSCPRCGEDFALVVNQLPEPGRGSPLGGYCLVCSYRMSGWRIVSGRQTRLDHIKRTNGGRSDVHSLEKLD
jgi:hypothetical protein